MNLPCSVVRDLLPLYAEQMTGEESTALVEEHLAGCADCAALYENVKRPETADVASVTALTALKKDIRKRRWQAAALAGLLVFLLVFGIFVQATGRYYIPYEEGMLDCEREGDALVIRFHVLVSGTATRVETDPEGKRVLFLEAWRSRAGALGMASGERVYGETSELRHRDGGEITAVYYDWEPSHAAETNTAQIYGEPAGEGLMVLPRLALGYYALMAAALALALGLLWLIFRKKKAAAALRQSFFVPVAYLLGQLIVKGFVTVSLDMPRELALILIAAAGFYGLLTLVAQLWRQSRADRV